MGFDGGGKRTYQQGGVERSPRCCRGASGSVTMKDPARHRLTPGAFGSGPWKGPAMDNRGGDPPANAVPSRRILILVTYHEALTRSGDTLQRAETGPKGCCRGLSVGSTIG